MLTERSKKDTFRIMGRTAEFDRDQVLDAAIRIFARHGFAAASTADLLDGMGIGRQSLYGAFADKRGLFLEALKRYLEESLKRMREALAGKSALRALESAVLIDLGSPDDVESGCLGVGSIAEFGRSDAEINALNDQASAAVLRDFAERVRAGIKAGELDASLDPMLASRMLLTLRSGLKIAVRGGATDREVRETARLALRGLSS
jgi:TetR/AcrR family transcriptional repressor of nem operon